MSAKKDYDAAAFPDNPEVIIGFVAPIGTPLRMLEPILVDELDKREYESVKIRVSDFTRFADPKFQVPAEESYGRYSALMNLGNDLRKRSGRNDILALFTAARIAQERPADEPRHLIKTAFLVSQLKHPEEVFRLRRIYGDNFVLFGLYCPLEQRLQFLKTRGLTESEAKILLQRDEDEKLAEGQRVSDTFHLADAFISIEPSANEQELRRNIVRVLDLLFGTAVVTPTREEHGMFLASAAAMRSGSLARQVGAALVSLKGDLIAVGTNEVPSPLGGLYWGDERDSAGKSFDARDHIFGQDMSDRMKFRVVEEILGAIVDGFTGLRPEDKTTAISEAVKRLKGTRVANLTEFARAVHAEMDALMCAARVGVSPIGATLYVTTFPCHGCAKHIVTAGVRRVVFIEPYPKSLALELHRDAIHLDGLNQTSPEVEWQGKEPLEDDKIHFAPFVGIAPRRFQDLFSRSTWEGRMAEVKDSAGKILPTGLGLRIPPSPFSYLVRENLAAGELQRIKEVLGVDPQGHFAFD
jgi:deoxycytidylate deaminase